MLDYFTYDDLQTTDFGAYVFGGGTFGTPEKNTESVAVDGRNGYVLFDYGNFKNLDIEYQCIIMKDFRRKFVALKSEFLSKNAGKYYEIRDTFNPDFFRLGVLRKISKPKISNDYDAGTFTMTFECKPQLFYADQAEVIVTDSAQILNNTGFTAYPLIEITGHGSFMIGSNAVTISDHTGKIFYDTEINEAYGSAGENMNQYVTLTTDVPVLNQGDNGVTVTDVSLVIHPRMYQL